MQSPFLFLDEVTGFDYNVINLNINMINVNPLNGLATDGIRVVFTDGTYGMRIVDFFGVDELQSKLTYNMPLSMEDVPAGFDQEGLKPNSEFYGVIVYEMDQQNNEMNLTFTTKQG